MILDFWSRWQQRQIWLASSHNHIKTTTKIQNNHHSEPSEIKLNGSLITMELKKPHPSRLVGGPHMQNRLVPHPSVVDKNSGGISWEQGVPAPTPDTPGPGFQEDKYPQLLAAKTSRDWVSGNNCWIPKQFLLKSPHMNLPTQTHSLWTLEPE